MATPVNSKTFFHFITSKSMRTAQIILIVSALIAVVPILCMPGIPGYCLLAFGAVSFIGKCIYLCGKYQKHKASSALTSSSQATPLPTIAKTEFRKTNLSTSSSNLDSAQPDLASSSATSSQASTLANSTPSSSSSGIPTSPQTSTQTVSNSSSSSATSSQAATLANSSPSSSSSGIPTLQQTSSQMVSNSSSSSAISSLTTTLEDSSPSSSSSGIPTSPQTSTQMVSNSSSSSATSSQATTLADSSPSSSSPSGSSTSSPTSPQSVSNSFSSSATSSQATTLADSSPSSSSSGIPTSPQTSTQTVSNSSSSSATSSQAKTKTDSTPSSSSSFSLIDPPPRIPKGHINFNHFLKEYIIDEEKYIHFEDFRPKSGHILSVNAVNHIGLPLIHRCVLKCCPEAIIFLIENDVDFNVKAAGQTPLELAIKKSKSIKKGQIDPQYRRIIKILNAHNAITSLKLPVPFWEL